MSIKSFIAKLWNNMLLKFNSIPAETKNAIHIGVIVTENIKKFVDSPLADILTALIPGDVDDKIKEVLRAQLPVILTNLKLADECSGLTEPAAITQCAVKVLQGLDKAYQNAFLHNLSVLIAQVAADGKLTWSDGVMLAEWYYQHKYTNPE